MNRKQIRERVETALQDVENKHWSDREINVFIDDALTEFTRIARYPQVDGTATNPGGGTSLGEASQTATLSVDGKTATLSNFGDGKNPWGSGLKYRSNPASDGFALSGGVTLSLTLAYSTIILSFLYDESFTSVLVRIAYL